MLKALFTRREPAPLQEAPFLLDRYVHTAPSAQNAVDLFKGEWASRLPDALGVTSGEALLFADPRLKWAIESLGGVLGQEVLELGPLEGGHSYVLEKAGAASVVAVEANTRAYLKCLVVKELLGLKTRFLLGEMNAYLDHCDRRFGLCLASGVLYHQLDPAQTLERIARVADRMILWTHYYDPAIIPAHPTASRFAKKPERRALGELGLAYWRREYQESLQFAGFCGGTEAFAHWMERGDILRALKHLGYTSLTIGQEEPEHPNGPCFMIAANK